MDIRIIELLAAHRRLRAREHWTRKALEDYQAQAMRLVREYAYTHSPFYQQFHQGLYDAPLQDLDDMYVRVFYTLTSFSPIPLTLLYFNY